MTLWAQDTPAAKPASEEAGPSASAPPRSAESTARSPTPATPAAGSAAAPRVKEINVFDLAMQGGIFMYPIYALSLIAVAVVFERFVGLRREKVFPESLVAALGHLGASKTGFDPRRAYRLCQEHPSAAANVIKAMLLKVGRPHSEVEHTVKEASEREANRLYGNFRWLNLSAVKAIHSIIEEEKNALDL